MAADGLALFPESFAQHNAPDAPRYRRVANLFAVLGPLPAALQTRLVHSFSSGQVHVCRGEPPSARELAPGSAVTAVYRLEGTGPDAAPTGRVFVRFAPGVPAGDRVGDLAGAGYQIDVVPEYAPHAAWLRFARGDAGAALAGVEELSALHDVVRIEPEVVSERRTR